MRVSFGVNATTYTAPRMSPRREHYQRVDDDLATKIQQLEQQGQQVRQVIPTAYSLNGSRITPVSYLILHDNKNNL